MRRTEFRALGSSRVYKGAIWGKQIGNPGLNSLSVSPVVNRVAVESRDDDWDIWVASLDQPEFDRLTFDPASDKDPLWTPDGQRVVFTSNRHGRPNLYIRRADGTGEVTRLTESSSEQIATSISPDGMLLVFTEVDPGTRLDIGLIGLDEPGSAELILDSAFREQNGVISPNGRWLAYQSDEAGQDEIYLREFPHVEGPRSRMSARGGNKPMWSRDGRELFFLDGYDLYAVPIDSESGTRLDLPSLVFNTTGRFNMGPEFVRRRYDLSVDGERFLMIGVAGADDEQPAAPNIIVAQHWFEELKRLVPIP